MAQTVKVEIIKKANDKKLHSLRIRITENRKHKYKSLGINLLKSHWDYKNERINSKNKDYKIYNEKITNTLKELNEANNNINALNSDNTTIADYWELHAKTTTNAGTKDNRKATLKKFRAFLKAEKIEGLKFNQLNPDIVKLYETYLLNKLTKRSVNSYIGYFKAVVNKAIKHQLVNYRVHPFILHKRLNNDRKKARALTVEQVRELMSIKLKPRQDYHRNLFLFQIMAGGLRIRDVICLKWRNIEVNANGIYLNYIQSKTNKQINTKLSYKALKPLNHILMELQPTETKTVIGFYSHLEKLLSSKADYEKENKYSQLTDDKLKEYIHYDQKNKKYYEFKNADKSKIYEIDINQQIEDYTSSLFMQYIIIFGKLHKEKPSNYIFNLMNGIELPENNTDFKIKNKIQGKIGIVNYHLEKIAKKMNIPTFTTHTARHTFAQVLVNSNTNLFYIQQFLGHSSLRVTQNYVRSLDNDKLDEVSETLASHF
jgi:site-specific recombinase XerD